MIGHKLPNKTKSATIAEPKLFHQLNNPKIAGVRAAASAGQPSGQGCHYRTLRLHGGGVHTKTKRNATWLTKSNSKTPLPTAYRSASGLHLLSFYIISDSVPCVCGKLTILLFLCILKSQRRRIYKIL
jgi:hypothetical protein